MQCANLILIVTGIYLLAGLAMFAFYMLTNNPAWVEQFFRIPGAMLFIVLASLQFGFALLVWQQFDAGEPMRFTWAFMSAAGLCELIGSLSVQLFAADSPLNLLRNLDFWSEDTARAIREFGTVVGGTGRFTLFAVGLYGALQVYRRSGFLGRLTGVDRIILTLLGSYVVWEAVDVGIALRNGKHPEWAEIAGWPVDPLLWLLLLEAALLYRSVRLMGFSWVGRCWLAFAAGIVLVAAGDISLWAAAYGYLRWPWSALEWYVWLPASAAFAVAPAYQLEAMQSATMARREEP